MTQPISDTDRSATCAEGRMPYEPRRSYILESEGKDELLRRAIHKAIASHQYNLWHDYSWIVEDGPFAESYCAVEAEREQADRERFIDAVLAFYSPEREARIAALVEAAKDAAMRMEKCQEWARISGGSTSWKVLDTASLRAAITDFDNSKG